VTIVRTSDGSEFEGNRKRFISCSRLDKTRYDRKDLTRTKGIGNLVAPAATGPTDVDQFLNALTQLLLAMRDPQTLMLVALALIVVGIVSSLAVWTSWRRK